MVWRVADPLPSDVRPVYDWNRAPLGVVVHEPRPDAAPRALVVSLHPEVRTRLGIEADVLEVPLRYVFSIRRDAITLSESIAVLTRGDAARPRTEAPSAVLARTSR